MGKLLKQQRRGKGSGAYRAPSHRYKADVSFRPLDATEREGVLRGQVAGFVDDPAHHTPLMEVQFANGERHAFFAPEGIALGDEIFAGSRAPLVRGGIVPLSRMPDGAYVYNVEQAPGDGGRYARAPGAYAIVTGREKNMVFVKMPSRQVLSLQGICRAQIGINCGGGRLEKPLMKAGANFHKKHAQNRKWPVNRGVHMCAYTHPFGGKQHHKGRSSATSRGAPPGRKVGNIAARSMGRKKVKIGES